VLSTRDVAQAMCAPKADANKMRVGDAMHKDPYVCGPATPISEAALQMETHRYGCAIVVERDELLGVSTTIDALRALRQLATGKPAERAVEPTLVVESRPNPHPEGVLRRVRLHRHRDIAAHSGIMAGQGKMA
jgi:CBS domain-containing protein